MASHCRIWSYGRDRPGNYLGHPSVSVVRDGIWNIVLDTRGLSQIVVGVYIRCVGSFAGIKGVSPGCGTLSGLLIGVGHVVYSRGGFDSNPGFLVVDQKKQLIVSTIWGVRVVVEIGMREL